MVFEYEPSIAPATFTATWRENFNSQQQQASSVYSSPVSPASDAGEDCAFEYDVQSPGSPRDGDYVAAEEAENTDWEHASPSLALNGIDDLQRDTSEVSIALVGTFIRDPDLGVRLMDKKFGQQDAWNGRIQKYMEDALETHHKIDLLEKQVAALQAKLSALNNNKKTAHPRG
ncbi:hypothetical protein N7478_003792 [Penicillium angulare]|uniref:uncharacterized protein n=1 Tax=Penicillium angulare TaxID=116970 RepID=UPI002541DCA9|nr:uncharacterized protein N7478_003792 [Penicillium angulare]KAJ5288106.1 hypothetical protein N7478_003792 [Penicillium angulare]